MLYLQIQTNDEDNGYAHVQVHLDAQQVLHLIAIKTGFTKDASLDPLQEPTATGMVSILVIFTNNIFWCNMMTAAVGISCKLPVLALTNFDQIKT